MHFCKALKSDISNFLAVLHVYMVAGKKKKGGDCEMQQKREVSKKHEEIQDDMKLLPVLC